MNKQQWYPNADPVLLFMRLLIYGFEDEAEEDLRQRLQVPDRDGKPHDDLWALLRLVMFGNISAFIADDTDMCLTQAPVDMVIRVAEFTHDSTIGEELRRLAPPPDPAPWLTTGSAVGGPTPLLDVSLHVPVSGHIAASTEVIYAPRPYSPCGPMEDFRPAYAPMEQDFAPFYMPGSPSYAPESPF